MVQRVVAAAVVSAVAMFMWGFLFWGLSGASSRLLKPLPQTAVDDVTAVLRRDNVAPGMYLYPPPLDPSADEQAEQEFQAMYQAGPILQMAVQDGHPPMPPSTFAAGLGLNFVYALLAGTLVVLAGGALETLGRRFAFVAIFGLAGAVWTNLGDAIWWCHSLKYAAGNAFYQLVAGLLMAAAIAAIVRPRPIPAA